MPEQVQDAVPVRDGMVEDEVQDRRILEDDLLRHERLDLGLAFDQAADDARLLLLVFRAEDADVHGGGLQVGGAVHAGDGYDLALFLVVSERLQEVGEHAFEQLVDADETVDGGDRVFSIVSTFSAFSIFLA